MHPNLAPPSGFDPDPSVFQTDPSTRLAEEAILVELFQLLNGDQGTMSVNLAIFLALLSFQSHPNLVTASQTADRAGSRIALYRMLF